ncbi:MAG TPA: hypothetical protein PK869_13915 [Candidatus Hydrogenedentes bacterium]|nr:hypothetical protein [Candidatus Hydrogenedentota bacterium]
MKQAPEHNFVICVRNDDYPASLEKRKLYEALPDADAEKHNQIRVIDESGEDYLYPAEYFVPVKLSKATEQALISAA